MSNLTVAFSRRFVFVLMAMPLCCAFVFAGELEPGKVVEIKFAGAYVPPSLYNMVSGAMTPPTLEFRLPDNYSPDGKFPLLVYVPGNHGGPGGNVGNALTIAGPRDWVVASLPLFKSSLDRDEVAGGILVSFEDFATLSKAYAIMLGRLHELVPNIDPEQSAMVGFSNGALTIAVLVSHHDEFILSHFQSFCLVDQGMFHLSDLHKKRSRSGRFLILSGDDQGDLGRDLKIRGGQLLQDSWQLLGVDLSFRVMKDTGHEFRGRHMAIVGRWLRQEAFLEGEVVTGHQ